MRWDFEPASPADLAVANKAIDTAGPATPGSPSALPKYAIRATMSISIPFSKPVPSFMINIIRSNIRSELETSFSQTIERIAEVL